MTSHRIAVIAGDGIGKETMPEGLRVVDAAARKFGIDLKFDHFDFSSWDYFEKHGKMLPDDWKKQIGGHDAIFFGAVGWPQKIADHVSLWGSLLLFRREFDQYINLRPARLLLTGGADVAPSRYGEPAHATVEEAEPGRDEFEIALITAARRRDLPILAICRGVQILNVACGGTLVQDIPSQIAGALPHSLAVPLHEPYELAHEVWVDKDSLLARLMRERLVDEAIEVNSRHHQAVKTIATGFVASATAPDGVIEAIEDPAARFCLGVQWHPENFFRTGEFRALFEGFLEASQNI